MFDLVPIIFLFLVPAITMRLISEEMKSGTMELLATKPIKDLEIVIGKFFAALGLIGLAILPTIFYYISIASIGDIDHGPVMGAYFGLMLMASVYISIGLLASSMTENQVVAFILGFAMILMLFLFDKILIFVPIWASNIFEFLGIGTHFSNFARGVVDTRDLIYFLSAFAFFIYLTLVSLGRRKW
jgi:ABC-2 type transport system permease protein